LGGRPKRHRNHYEQTPPAKQAGKGQEREKKNTCHQVPKRGGGRGGGGGDYVYTQKAEED